MTEKIVLFDIDYTIFNTDAFKESELQNHSAYIEVEEVLKKLSEMARLGIFSEGENGFQREKLKKTGIGKYFQEADTFIFSKKEEQLGSVLQNYEGMKIFLVDDKLNVLYNAKKMNPSIFAVWVKRGIYAQNQAPIEGFTPDAIVENLIQIPKIVSVN